MSFVALERVDVATATKDDATNCETDSGKQTELNAKHLKTNSGNTVITLRTRLAL